MTAENLSAVWGPTLMHAGENSAEEWNRAETKVVGDLIRLYPKLYQLSPADLAKEAKMLEVLEKHVTNNGPRGAPSGDLKIWIYILSPDGECVNVTVRIFSRFNRELILYLFPIYFSKFLDLFLADNTTDSHFPISRKICWMNRRGSTDDS